MRIVENTFFRKSGRYQLLTQTLSIRYYRIHITHILYITIDNLSRHNNSGFDFKVFNIAVRGSKYVILHSELLELGYYSTISSESQ